MYRHNYTIMQNGFVVDDWRAAAELWSSQLGVGPFYAMEHVEFDWCEYRGERVDLDISVAIAYVGAHQIELAQQHNDAPSIYTRFLSEHAPGLHHVGALVDDVEACIAERKWENRIVQQGCTKAGARFAYIDSNGHNGSMIELIERSEAVIQAFEFMQAQALNWDGTRPIR